MSKDPNQWSLCCLNMLDRTSCVFVTGVVLVAWQRCRWVCYVGCEPTFERDWFLYLFLRPSHDVWLWRDILHKNQLMLCIPQMVKENHASINHYGPPTLAPYFVKIAAANFFFYSPKTPLGSLEIFWPIFRFDVTGMWNTFLCWSSFVSENPNQLRNATPPGGFTLGLWRNHIICVCPQNVVYLPKGDEFPLFFKWIARFCLKIWAGKVL